ncbi:uncharacterized protein LOC117115769 isoform X2 [Anneissia japonica]|uniref:uncharacterized protein LOC117115769 isoform X2 n=1 Tax=Anneissia japonica TaxID=1529436 RepID=UPI0014254D3D|nr:uncharacterized protein LOC117115769 isoform X2 [Anneissia japonica]
MGGNCSKAENIEPEDRAPFANNNKPCNNIDLPNFNLYESLTALGARSTIGRVRDEDEYAGIFPAEDLLGESKALLAKNLDILKGTSDFTTIFAFEALQAIHGTSTRHKPDEERQVLGDFLADIGYAELFLRMWHSLDTEDLYDEENGRDALLNLKKMKSGFMNFSDASPLMCKRLGECGALSLLLTDLEDPRLEVSMLTDRSRRHAVKGTLGILHNCLRMQEENRQLLRDDSVIELLMNFTQSTYLIVKATCYLVLAYIVEEDDKDDIHDQCIEFLVRMLEDALKNPDHVRKRYGFTAGETIRALRHMLLKDSNKTRIKKRGVLPSFRKMLENSFSSTDQLISIECMWNMAFVDENREAILNTEGTIEALQDIATNCRNTKVQQACNGALWEIFKGEVSEVESIGGAKGGARSGSRKIVEHVMISYEDSSKNAMNSLKEKIKLHGFNVWMEEDKAGDMLTSMSQAVENAAVVIAGMSSKYKDNLGCRTELTYAKRLDKPIIPLLMEENYEPDGWLSDIEPTEPLYLYLDEEHLASFLPDVLHIIESVSPRMATVAQRNNEREELTDEEDVHADKDTDECTDDSVQELGAGPAGAQALSLVETDQYREPPPYQSHEQTVPLTGETDKKSYVTDKAFQWAKIDVQKWLKECGLGQLRKKLSRYDGEMLGQLYTVSQHAPEFFYSALRQDLGIKDLLTILKFTKAMEALGMHF